MQNANNRPYHLKISKNRRTTEITARAHSNMPLDAPITYLHHIHPAGDAAEHGVLVVQPRGRHRGDEKLRPVCCRPCLFLFLWQTSEESERNMDQTLRKKKHTHTRCCRSLECCCWLPSVNVSPHFRDEQPKGCVLRRKPKQRGRSLYCWKAR